MSQLMHCFIALALWLITWHGFLKKHPVMQENISKWQEWINKKFF